MHKKKELPGVKTPLLSQEEQNRARLETQPATNPEATENNGTCQAAACCACYSTSGGTGVTLLTLTALGTFNPAAAPTALGCGFIWLFGGALGCALRNFVCDSQSQSKSPPQLQETTLETGATSGVTIAAFWAQPSKPIAEKIWTLLQTRPAPGAMES